MLWMFYYVCQCKCQTFPVHNNYCFILSCHLFLRLITILWIVARCTFHLVTDSQCFLRLIFLIMLCLQKIILILIFLHNRVQRKSFLQLAIWASWTSFQPAPQTFWKAELISQFFSYANSSKDITCPSVKLKNRIHPPDSKIL